MYANDIQNEYGFICLQPCMCLCFLFLLLFVVATIVVIFCCRSSQKNMKKVWKMKINEKSVEKWELLLCFFHSKKGWGMHLYVSIHLYVVTDHKNHICFRKKIRTLFVFCSFICLSYRVVSFSVFSSLCSRLFLPNRSHHCLSKFLVLHRRIGRICRVTKFLLRNLLKYGPEN